MTYERTTQSIKDHRRREATARFHEKIARAYREHGREADADTADKAARLARGEPKD